MVALGPWTLTADEAPAEVPSFGRQWGSSSKTPDALDLELPAQLLALASARPPAGR